jgi:hypothetical protein
MRRYGRLARGGRSFTGRWSHLMADDPEELVAFAARLGLRPEWRQSPGTAREHYDVVETVRRRAVAAGAVPISYPHGTSNLIAAKRVRASAVAAAARGWYVFPLRPGLKSPAVRDWENQATTDPERIRDLWASRLRRGWRVAGPPNLGVACGPSGLVVLDLDLAKPGQDRSRWGKRWHRTIASGVEVLTLLGAQAGRRIPETYVVTTPSGGRHLYFAAPGDVPVRNSAGHIGPMIDVRGQGGYVVAAGSRLHSHATRDKASVGVSGAYRAVNDLEPAQLPEWLTDAAAAGRQRDALAAAGCCPRSRPDQSLTSSSGSYGTAALRNEAERVRSAPVGQRNHTLNLAAYRLGQLVAAGALEQALVVEVLTDAAAAAGLDAPEVAATVDSGLAAGLKRPRALPPRRHAPVETGAGR